MALITGSSHLHLGIAAMPVHRPGVWGTYMDAVYPGKAIIEGGQTSTGSVIAWFKRHFAPDTSFDELNEAASALEPGAEGLVVLDHFQGNRTPYTDAASRGAIAGLTLKHTPTHVFRAIVESICLGTRLIIDSFGEAFCAKRIVVAGWSKQLSILASDSRRHDRRPARTDRSSRCAGPRLRDIGSMRGKAICNY
jgi:ribulose kinase